MRPVLLTLLRQSAGVRLAAEHFLKFLVLPSSSPKEENGSEASSLVAVVLQCECM